MFRRFLDPVKRQQKRYQRALSHLESLDDRTRRVIDASTRENLQERHAWQAKLARRLGRRMEELPLTRDPSFDWLRADVEKSLASLEAAIDRLRLDSEGLELRETLPTQPPTPDKLPNPPKSNPQSEAATPVSPTPLPPRGATAARTSESPRTNPNPPVGQAPQGPGPKRWQRRQTSATAVATPPSAASPRSGSTLRETVPASPRIRRLSDDLQSWRRQLDGLAAEISRMEHQPPELLFALEWRELIQITRNQIRRVREQLGACRRWLRAGGRLILVRQDWEGDFRKAGAEMERLQAMVGRLSDPAAIRQIAEAKRAPLALVKKPEIGPISLSHPARSRIRQRR